MVRAGRCVYQKHDEETEIHQRLEYTNAFRFMLVRICTNAQQLQVRYPVAYNTHATLHANANAML